MNKSAISSGQELASPCISEIAVERSSVADRKEDRSRTRPSFLSWWASLLAHIRRLPNVYFRSMLERLVACCRFLRQRMKTCHQMSSDSWLKNWGTWTSLPRKELKWLWMMMIFQQYLLILRALVCALSELHYHFSQCEWSIANFASQKLWFHVSAGTPYENGSFRMKLLLSHDFPQSPPKGAPIFSLITCLKCLDYAFICLPVLHF